MKKRAIFLISLLSLFLFLIIPVISAVEIKLSKTSYQPQETLQAEITGSFISLSLENILIYEQNTPRSQPVVSDLIKQGEIYYFYAILPNQQGNFSLKIENAEYSEAGQLKTNTINKEFKIEKTNISSLQINPGFILTSSDFSIKIKALNSNQGITAIFNQQPQNLSLVEDIQKIISFSISDLKGKYDLKINTYTIPVFIIEKKIINSTLVNQTNQTSTQTNQTIHETKINIENKTKDEIKSLYCSDFGKECRDNEKCDAGTIPAFDSALCCPGNCIEVKESKTGTIIGILLLIIVVVLIVVIYWRSKKKQKPKSTDEILKSKEKQFQARMQEQGSEVTRSLRKV
jgi:hypothetical protein